MAEDEIEEEEVIEKESCKEEDVTPIETPMKEEIEIPCKNEREMCIRDRNYIVPANADVISAVNMTLLLPCLTSG